MIPTSSASISQLEPHDPPRRRLTWLPLGVALGVALGMGCGGAGSQGTPAQPNAASADPTRATGGTDVGRHAMSNENTGEEPVRANPMGGSPAGSSIAMPSNAPDSAATSPASPNAALATPATSSTPGASAPATPPSQGRCPDGMAEFGGGTFKSSYYRVELAVEPFCLDRHLTTTDEYAACVATGACDTSAVHACDPSTWQKEGRGKLPMICIDFMQAERYCKAQGKRIVSDLEWEWAARGGSEARAYPWGSDAPADQLCWSGKDKRELPCPAGAQVQGITGLTDLVGNVYQWTTTTNDPVSSFRGGRGGSWKSTAPAQVAVTHRGGFKNTYRCGFLGIRCASSLPKPAP